MKFVWRVIMRQNVKTAQRALGEAALAALKAGVEVVDAPLVGNSPGRVDVAAGKLKGAHDPGTAERIIAAHFAPGVLPQ